MKYIIRQIAICALCVLTAAATVACYWDAIVCLKDSLFLQAFIDVILGGAFLFVTSSLGVAIFWDRVKSYAEFMKRL